MSSHCVQEFLDKIRVKFFSYLAYFLARVIPTSASNGNSAINESNLLAQLTAAQLQHQKLQQQQQQQLAQSPGAGAEHVYRDYVNLRPPPPYPGTKQMNHVSSAASNASAGSNGMFKLNESWVTVPPLPSERDSNA